MNLSTRAKESIKTALAMTIAYGIALQMDWDKPYWAGFAVAFISLETIGQSLNKGAMRMLGTGIGMLVALTLIALFAQDRWPFMVFLSAWIGFCTYMMSGTKRQYFWHVSGFVSVVICMDAGPDAVNAFEIATLRAQETGLGILVYSLVALLLWPSNSRAGFDAIVGKLASTQHQLYRAYLDLMSAEDKAEEAQALRAQAMQEHSRFNQLLDAAEADSYEVWELRRQWRRYQRQVTRLAETMEHWRQGFAEVQTLDLQGLLPNLADFDAELDRRFAEGERMLANQPPQQQPAAIDLDLDEARLRALPPFQKAALAVTRTRLQGLEALTGSLFDSVRDIKGFGPAAAEAGSVAPPRSRFVPDPDRLAGSVRIMSIMWLAYLALIYVSDLPGGPGFVSMACPLGMALATTPHLVSRLFVPAGVGTLFAALVYIFLMPQLSSFVGLGPLIFAVTFAICYLYAAPQQVLGRAFGLAMFVSIAGISNQQTYSFLAVANTALMLPLMFLLLSFTAYIPLSPRPERAFQRLLGRFFRSCEFLVSTLDSEPRRAPWRHSRWRQAFHAQEISSLPQKLGAWGKSIDTKALPGTSPQQVQALVTSLQALSYRVRGLLEQRDGPQAQFLVQQLREDVAAWRLLVQETFKRLSVDPALGEHDAFRAKLDEVLEHLEARIQETVDEAGEEQLSAQDGENFYRLLGAFRSVSEALVDFAGSAGDIDWIRWREERFA